MHLTTHVISEIDLVLLDFARCINDLHFFKDEISLVDIEQANQRFKLLRNAIHEQHLCIHSCKQ